MSKNAQNVWQTFLLTCTQKTGEKCYEFCGKEEQKQLYEGNQQDVQKLARSNTPYVKYATKTMGMSSQTSQKYLRHRSVKEGSPQSPALLGTQVVREKKCNHTDIKVEVYVPRRSEPRPRGKEVLTKCKSSLTHIPENYL